MSNFKRSYLLNGCEWEAHTLKGKRVYAYLVLSPVWVGLGLPPALAPREVLHYRADLAALTPRSLRTLRSLGPGQLLIRSGNVKK